MKDIKKLRRRLRSLEEAILLGRDVVSAARLLKASIDEEYAAAPGCLISVGFNEYEKLRVALEAWADHVNGEDTK